MESATKALAMAGGVLIAVLVITILVYSVQLAGQNKRDTEIIEKKAQVDAFNKEYDSYNKKLMRGTDVMSVTNMANNNNDKFAYDDNNKKIENNYIKVKIKLTKLNLNIEDKENNVQETMNTGIAYICTDKNEKGYKIYQTILKDKKASTDFKRRFFKCTNMEYNPRTGKICLLEYEEMDVGDIPNY